MNRLARQRAALEAGIINAPFKEATVFIVTNRKITANIDARTKEASAATVAEAHIEESDASDALKLRDARDDRYRNLRVFGLTVDADGLPTIGAEL